MAFAARAAADLEAIAQWTHKHYGRAAAAAYANGLLTTCRKLHEDPQLGSTVPKLRLPVRRVPYRSHRIYYRVEDDCILIVRILHTAQDAGAAPS